MPRVIYFLLKSSFRIWPREKCYLVFEHDTDKLTEHFFPLRLRSCFHKFYFICEKLAADLLPLHTFISRGVHIIMNGTSKVLFCVNEIPKGLD